MLDIFAWIVLVILLARDVHCFSSPAIYPAPSQRAVVIRWAQAVTVAGLPLTTGRASDRFSEGR